MKHCKLHEAASRGLRAAAGASLVPLILAACVSAPPPRSDAPPSADAEEAGGEVRPRSKAEKAKAKEDATEPNPQQDMAASPSSAAPEGLQTEEGESASPVTPNPSSTAVPSEESKLPPEPPPIDTEKIFSKVRQPCDKPHDQSEPVIGKAQEVMAESTCNAALWFDSLFGDDRNIDSARDTHGYLEASTSYSQFHGYDTRVRFRVRFDLPNLEHRVSATLGRENEEDYRRDRSERFAVRSQFPGMDTGSSWLAGLGYSFPGTKRFSTAFRIGVAGSVHPRLYVQQPLRYTAFSDEDDFGYLRLTPFYNTDDGVGVTAGADYDRVLGRHFLLRFSEIGTVSQETSGVDWRSSVILYHHLRDERALAYELLIRGETEADEELLEYGGRVVYRQPIIRHKLYAEFLAGYTWPKLESDQDRDGSAEAGLSLEVPFGTGTERDFQ